MVCAEGFASDVDQDSPDEAYYSADESCEGNPGDQDADDEEEQSCESVVDLVCSRDLPRVCGILVRIVLLGGRRNVTHRRERGSWESY